LPNKCKVITGLIQKCKVLLGLNQNKCKDFLGRDRFFKAFKSAIHCVHSVGLLGYSQSISTPSRLLLITKSLIFGNKSTKSTESRTVCSGTKTRRTPSSSNGNTYFYAFRMGVIHKSRI